MKMRDSLKVQQFDNDSYQCVYDSVQVVYEVFCKLNIANTLKKGYNFGKKFEKIQNLKGRRMEFCSDADIGDHDGYLSPGISLYC